MRLTMVLLFALALGCRSPRREGGEALRGGAAAELPTIRTAREEAGEAAREPVRHVAMQASPDGRSAGGTPHVRAGVTGRPAPEAVGSLDGLGDGIIWDGAARMVRNIPPPPEGWIWIIWEEWKDGEGRHVRALYTLIPPSIISQRIGDPDEVRVYLSEHGKDGSLRTTAPRKLVKR